MSGSEAMLIVEANEANNNMTVVMTASVSSHNVSMITTAQQIMFQKSPNEGNINIMQRCVLQSHTQ